MSDSCVMSDCVTIQNILQNTVQYKHSRPTLLCSTFLNSPKMNYENEPSPLKQKASLPNLINLISDDTLKRHNPLHKTIESKEREADREQTCGSLQFSFCWPGQCQRPHCSLPSSTPALILLTSASCGSSSV